MRNRAVRLYFILMVLWIYTTFKADQIWPMHGFLCATFITLLFIVMTSWLFVYRSNPSLIDNAFFKVFAWIGSLAMGFWSTFILFSIPVDIIFFANYLICQISSGSYNSEQVAFWWQRANLVLLSLSGLFTLLGLVEVCRGPRVKEVLVCIPSLPIALNNLTIAQISDLHIGPTIRRKYVEKVVCKTNATRPDLIL